MSFQKCLLPTPSVAKSKYISDEILFANNILKYNFFLLSNLWNFGTEIHYSRLSELEIMIVIMYNFLNEYLYNY